MLRQSPDPCYMNLYAWSPAAFYRLSATDLRLGGLFEICNCCLIHKQKCKYDYTTLYIYEPDKFINTIFKCFKCYFCIHGPHCILNGRALHYLKWFLCSMDIFGTSIYHTAQAGGIVPLTEPNLT